MTILTIRQARKLRGLTLRDLAREAGVALETVRRAEGGAVSPGPHTIIRLAGALGMPADGIAELRAAAGLPEMEEHKS